MSSQSQKQLETFLDTFRDGGYNFVDPQERPSVVIRSGEPTSPDEPNPSERFALHQVVNSKSFTATQGRDWIVSIEFVFAENQEFFTLEEMQKEVGGLIQVVPLIPDQASEWKDFVILVNEEGMLQDLPPNVSSLYFEGHTLFGNVLIIHKSRWV